jgi:ABC-2 type transport system ATP-binding protein
MNAVELAQVTKEFDGRPVVHNLDLRIARGSILGLVGPNGSGKTTTLRMILRILFPDSGEVRVLGHVKGRAADSRVGYLPEERGLYRKMKVGDTIAFHAELKEVRLGRLEVLEWLDRFGLAEWENKPVQTLSKGMTQKLQFLTAIAHRPELLVLDEPLGGLDPINAELIEESILDTRRQGATVVFSTHDMNAAERLCDSICMIHRGKKVLDGTLEAIQQEHGKDVVKVSLEGFEGLLTDIAGVRSCVDRGRFLELGLEPWAQTQEILRALLLRSKVKHFEIARPDLRDIFIRIAGAKDTGGQERDDA